MNVLSKGPERVLFLSYKSSVILLLNPKQMKGVNIMGKLGLVIIGICLLFGYYICCQVEVGAISFESGVKLLFLVMSGLPIGFKLMEIIDD